MNTKTWNGTGKSCPKPNRWLTAILLALMVLASCEDLTGNTWISFRNAYFESVKVSIGGLTFGEVLENEITEEKRIAVGNHAIVINTSSGLTITQNLIITSKQSRIVVILEEDGRMELQR